MTSLDGVTVVVPNSDPFTYFRQRAIRVVEPAGLTKGSLSAAVLKRATVLELSTDPACSRAARGR